MKDQKGFTILEVMIALSIFSFFMVAYIASESGILARSFRSAQEATLRHYAQKKMDEIIINPPELADSLTITPIEGKFEEQEDIKFTITYARLQMPDVQKILGEEEGENENENSAQGKALFDAVTKNLKELLWQVEVRVTDSKSGRTLKLNTWIENPRAKVEFQGI